MINNKELICDISKLDFDKIREYYNENYYFQDEVDNLILEQDRIPSIIEKFLLSYLARVSELCKLKCDESEQFINWFNDSGYLKINPIIKNLDYSRIDIQRLVNIFTNYDVLMEQAVDEEDLDCLLNILIDIPLNLYRKMESWNCIKTETVEFNELAMELMESVNLESVDLSFNHELNNMEFNICLQECRHIYYKYIY